MAPQEDSQLVVDAKKIPVEPANYSYTEARVYFPSGFTALRPPQRDVILYNLGIGVTEKDLQWTYEGRWLMAIFTLVY